MRPQLLRSSTFTRPDETVVPETDTVANCWKQQTPKQLFVANCWKQCGFTVCASLAWDLHVDSDRKRPQQSHHTMRHVVRVDVPRRSRPSSPHVATCPRSAAPSASRRLLQAEKLAIRFPSIANSAMGLVHYPQFDWTVEPAILYGVPALYVVAAIAGNFAMRSRPAFEVGFAMKLYNVAQIVLCTYMSIGMFPSLGFPNIFGIGGPYTEVSAPSRPVACSLSPRGRQNETARCPCGRTGGRVVRLRPLPVQVHGLVRHAVDDPQEEI
eukprot:762463-Prymnesium_polylepis.4